MSRITHTNRNLAARMGRWSARHWKAATFGWLAFVLVAFGLGGMVGTRNNDQNSGPGESGRMDRILEAGFKQPASENVLIQSRSQRVGTAAFDAAIAAAKAARKRVFVPAGTYQVNRHIVVDNVSIEGAGNWWTIIRGREASGAREVVIDGAIASAANLQIGGTITLRASCVGDREALPPAQLHVVGRNDPGSDPEDNLLSTATDQSVSHAFNLLTHTVLNHNARTLEDLVTEMLRPMLRDWLDLNLPPLVERLVRAEIERVARGSR